MTVADLVQRPVPLQWHEAVAIVLEVAEHLSRSNAQTVPGYEQLTLEADGTITFGRGRQRGDVLPVLTRMLSMLLPEDRPTRLRLLASTASVDGATCTTVDAFTEALQYFDRPGRRHTLRDVHQRAIHTPISAEPPPMPVDPEPEVGRVARPRWMPRAAAALTVVTVLASGVWGIAWWQPWHSNARVAALGSRAVDVWDGAVGFGEVFTARASSDLTNLLAAIRERATGGAEADDEADAETLASTSDRQASRVPAAPDSTSTATALVASPQPAESSASADWPAADASASVVESVPMPMTPVFDQEDLDVEPPAILRPQLPTVQPRVAGSDVGLVEAVVSASGEVERVKLLSPMRSIHEGMLLSAIKTWRFRPATKDGRAVRYRHLIRLTVPSGGAVGIVPAHGETEPELGGPVLDATGG